MQKLEKGEYPEEKYLEYLQALPPGALVLQYADDQLRYRLEFMAGAFLLSSSPVSATENVFMQHLDPFFTLPDFWAYFSSDQQWYRQYRVEKVERVMEKFIITAHNGILESGVLTYEQHQQLHSWMNYCFNKELSRNIYWQFCAHCRELIPYDPRYPKQACRQCIALIRDELGRALDYRNIHELRWHNGTMHTVGKDTKQAVRLFIGQDEYFATEAKFGGIVFQKQEL